MWFWKKTNLNPRYQSRNRIWFVILGLLVTFGSSILLLLSGMWFFSQTNKLSEDYLRESNQLLADGLAFAISEEMVTKNYGKMEVHLLQAIFNPQLKSALAINGNGYAVSYVERDPATGKPVLSFLNSQFSPPQQKPWQSVQGDELVTWSPINPDFPMGWVRLTSHQNGNNELMKGLHQQTFLIFVLSALCFITIIGYGLMLTFRRVNVREKTLHESNSELRLAALHDSLTGLPNRELMIDRLCMGLSEAERTSECLAVCFVDLDGFKAVNDQHGHEVGDHLLIEISNRLLKCVREYDTVSRIGGDEFVLILKNVESQDNLNMILLRVLNSIRQPLQMNGRTIEVSCSIGYTVFPEDQAEATTLISHADEAMYTAKRTGKNQMRSYR